MKHTVLDPIALDALVKGYDSATLDAIYERIFRSFLSTYRSSESCYEAQERLFATRLYAASHLLSGPEPHQESVHLGLSPIGGWVNKQFTTFLLPVSYRIHHRQPGLLTNREYAQVLNMLYAYCESLDTSNVVKIDHDKIDLEAEVCAIFADSIIRYYGGQVAVDIKATPEPVQATSVPEAPAASDDIPDTLEAAVAWVKEAKEAVQYYDRVVKLNTKFEAAVGELAQAEVAAQPAEVGEHLRTQQQKAKEKHAEQQNQLKESIKENLLNDQHFSFAPQLFFLLKPSPADILRSLTS